MRIGARLTFRPTIAAGCLALAVAATWPAAPAQAMEPAAHRALYKLSLESSRGGDVVGAGGQMAYEVIDACDGWATRQRLQMTMTNRDGQDIQLVTDYVTWESKDGLSMRFHMRQTTDTAVTSETQGEAKLERTGGPGEATYSLPQVMTKKLPEGTLLPTMHTEALLAAAREGKKFLAVPLFDGTVDQGAQDSSVAILAWMPPEKSKFPILSDLPSARVHIAFFDRDAGAQQPDYEVGMRYWDNGIADDLHMDFGQFIMSGTLTDLTLPPHGC